jgi:hypothetical protein
MNPSHFAILQALPLVAILGLASPASAATGEDQAAADIIFKEGKKYADANDWGHACPKFVESQRLAPTTGTLLNIGNCYEKLNKNASAYGAFREAEVAARTAGDSARQAEAVRRAEALAPHLAKLAIVVPPTVRVSGFELKRDGSVVGEGQWGSSLPVDIGNHEIVASAPGHKPWSSVVRIDTNEGATSIEVAPLEKLPEGGAAAGTTGFTWSTRRTVGAVVGAVGLVGVAIGSAYTARMVSLNSQSLSDCQPANITLCSAAGVSLRNQAFDASHVATWTFIPGAALVATGILLMVIPSAPAKTDDAPTAQARVVPFAGPRLGGVALQGVW